ncbi:PaaI family thioesterase [Nocardioides alcanivorans]|uniref:PaaI family thioesterase n=1 Tax=Nocardioides alcanivorans TaxID=2897352 RepID=UPI001F4926A7|nr:PaaI family thioesterase [Nocardioides alcanivorans]
MRAGFDAPGQARADGEVWHSFANNPLAIPLDMIFEGSSVRASLTANALHEGPPDCLHGGLAAHLMDGLLGTMMQANGYRCRTGTLDIRYLRPTPLDKPLELVGEITSSNGRRHVTRGTISHNGEVTVEAKGLFVEVQK